MVTTITIVCNLYKSLINYYYNYNINTVNPSITDTIGTSKLVLLMEVSFVEGSFNIINYQNGTRKVSLVVRCPLFRGVLYKRLSSTVIIN